VPDGLYIDYLQSPNSEIIKQRILQKYPKASSFLNNDNLSVNIDAQKCSALLDANNVLG
jgi:hypothetical protein